MMELAFTVVFLFLFFLANRAYNKQDFSSFVLFLLMFITFSPMMQYVVFPDYKKYDLTGIRFLGVQRIWVEFIVTGVLFYFNGLIQSIEKTMNTKLNLILFLYFILNLTQFINCIDLNRAFSGFWMSVVNPILFIIIFDKLLRGFNFTIRDLISIVYKYSIFLLLGFYVFSIVNVSRGVVIDVESESLHLFGLGYGLGLFQSRIVMTVIFMFLPLIFLPKSSYFIELKYINYFIGSVFLTLVFCNSRTMYLAIVLMFLLVVILNPFGNRSSQIKLLLVLVISVVCIGIFSHSSIFEDVIAARFYNKGDTALASAMEDERFLIWEAAVREAERSNYLGIGIGNFVLTYYRNYSNAHSLYYSVLTERGIGVLILVIYIILHNIFKGWKTAVNNSCFFFKVLSIGTLSFAFVVYTGEELFNCAQVAYSVIPYLLMLSFCIIENFEYIYYEED